MYRGHTFDRQRFEQTLRTMPAPRLSWRDRALLCLAAFGIPAIGLILLIFLAPWPQ